MFLCGDFLKSDFPISTREKESQDNTIQWQRKLNIALFLDSVKTTNSQLRWAKWNKLHINTRVTNGSEINVVERDLRNPCEENCYFCMRSSLANLKRMFGQWRWNSRFHYTNLIMVRIYFLIISSRICLIIALYPLIYLHLMSFASFLVDIFTCSTNCNWSGLKQRKKSVNVVNDSMTKMTRTLQEYKLIFNFNNERSLFCVMYVVTLWPISVALTTGFQFSGDSEHALRSTKLRFTIALAQTNKTTFSLKRLIIGKNQHKDDHPISTVL